MGQHRWHMAVGIALALTACGGSEGDGSGGTSASGGGGMAAGGGDAGTLPFELTSTAFAEGETIPLEYECGAPAFPAGPGDNVSPPLSWTPGPAGTQSYALLMNDLDAMNLLHWAVYDIPATASGLPAGIPVGHELTEPAGAKQAELQGAFYGYLGPCSDSSVNTYQWTLHALDVPTLPGVDMSTTDVDIAITIANMSTATATLSGES